MFGRHIVKRIYNLYIEAVQRRAAIFTVNFYSRYESVSSMLENLNWPILEDCRKESKLVMMYKIIHAWPCTHSAKPSFNLLLFKWHHQRT